MATDEVERVEFTGNGRTVTLTAGQMDEVARRLKNERNDPGEWEKAPRAVIKMAQRLIAKYHPSLQSARIGILFKATAPTTNGRRTLGKAMKVEARIQPLLQEQLDFIIWLAADFWLGEASPAQKEALLDHELCHCRLVDGVSPAIRPHDIEEFAEIIERHGLWKEDLIPFAQAIKQYQLPFTEPVRPGRVVALEPEQWATVPAVG